MSIRHLAALTAAVTVLLGGSALASAATMPDKAHDHGPVAHVTQHPVHRPVVHHPVVHHPVMHHPVAVHRVAHHTPVRHAVAAHHETEHHIP